MKRVFSYAAAIIIILTSASQSAEKMQIAVMDLKAREVTRTLSQIISDLIRGEMVKTGRFTVIERGQMDAILNEQGFQKTGCTDSACAVQIGKLLSAKKILIGEASKLGSSILITVRIVDVEKGIAEFAESEKAESENDIDKACKLLTIKLTKNIVTGDKTDLTNADEGKISFDKKFQIYESASKSQGYGCCWALVIPGGQHFYSRNYGTGALYLLGSVASYVLFISYSIKSNDYDLSESEREKNSDRANLAAVILTALRIGEVIHGYYSIENYNEKLRKDLDVISGENDTALDFNIAYNPKTAENQYLLGMSLKF